MRKAMIRKTAALVFILLILLTFPACAEKTKTRKEATKVLTEKESTGIKGSLTENVITDEEIAEIETEISEIDMLMQDIESEEEIEVGDFSEI